MKIAIRADASLTIGFGHIMRCAVLAAALRQAGGEILFICREHPGHYCDWLEAQGYQMARLPAPVNASSLDVAPEQDSTETAAVLAKDGMLDWLIVDHYNLDARWESTLRPYCRRLLVIDDLADRDHDCDLLLDQNLQTTSGRYLAHLPPQALALLGPRYALLRPEFAQARQGRDRHPGNNCRLLVFFGAADPQGMTLRALAAIARLPAAGLAVDVVIGRSNPHGAEIAACVAALPDARLHVQTPRMAALMAGADLLLGAAGSAVWESCCLQLPALLVVMADNQAANAAALAELGGAINLGTCAEASENVIHHTLAWLLASPGKRQHMAERIATLVDGKGCERVVRRLLQPEIALRPATLADADNLHRWRDHPATRRHSHDASPIDYASHVAWLQGTLANPERLLLIARVADTDIGVLRYDMTDHRQATVSVYLVPEQHGNGYGAPLIQAGTAWLMQRHPEIRGIVAEVKADNHASLAAFRAAGFAGTSPRLYKSLTRTAP